MPDPPVPVLGQFSTVTKVISITFDKPLEPGSFDDRNWFARFTNRLRTPGLVRVFPGQPTVCQITTIIGPADLGPDIAQYTAAVPDLIGQNGAPVAPFTQPLVGV